MLPVSLIVQPKLVGIITGSLMGVYLLGIIFFNAIHLRRKKEMVSWKIIPIYFLMKFALTFVNTLSVYYSLYAYADFFSQRHPRVTENFPALMAAKECLDADSARKQGTVVVEVATSENEDQIIVAPVPPAVLR